MRKVLAWLAADAQRDLVGSFDTVACSGRAVQCDRAFEESTLPCGTCGLRHLPNNGRRRGIDGSGVKKPRNLKHSNCYCAKRGRGPLHH
jgi:hypothetical protein